MKKTFSFFALCAITALGISCNKDCTVSDGSCRDKVPTDELCEAHFERWFYNEKTDNCTLEAYSGCSAKGFATQAECESCECNK